MFQLHKTLLQLCKHKDNYSDYHKQLPTKGLDEVTRLWLEVYAKYFSRFEHNTVQLDSLLTLMAQLDYDQDSMDRIAVTWDTIKEEPDKESARGITKGLAELKAAHDLGQILIAYEDGEDIELHEACSGVIERLGRQSNLNINPASDRWEDILVAVHDPGKKLTFPLDCLNASANDVSTQTQMIIAARPDIGKTSLCSFFAVNYAKQIPDGRTILIINNEGTKYEWMSMCYRSALGKTIDELAGMDMLEVQAAYDRAVGKNKIVIVDAHNQNLYACERLIQKHKPMVVFWDMLDNVAGFEDKGREDLILEAKYQFTRGLAVTYDFLSLPTSQIVVAGEGIEFPHKGLLKGSGTAKQGACKTILMMGHSLQPGKERERYFSFSKNKYTQAPGARKDCGKAAYFQWEIARFKEP